MIIRPAEKEDLEQLLDLYEAVASEGRWIGGEAPIDREKRRQSWLELMDSDEHCSVVAEQDGRIVGNAALHGTGLADLGMLVAADWRGRGVGSLLLEACIDWARRVGAYKITLQVWPHNEAAIHLYEKFGFEREGYLRKQWRRRNGELWDAVVMGLILDETARPPHPSHGTGGPTCGH